MLCTICVVQVQHKKHVLAPVEYAAPTRQHDGLVDRTWYETEILSALEETVHHEVGIDR